MRSGSRRRFDHKWLGVDDVVPVASEFDLGSQDHTEWLSGVDIRAVLAAVAAAVAREPAYAAAVCRLSYVHPNGFTKLVLAHRLPSWALRLHVWRVPVHPNDNDIHDHCGPLTSRVLIGEIVNETYEVADDGTVFERYIDEASASTHNLTRAGSTMLALSSSDRHSHGSCYSLPFDVLHRTDPLGQFPVVTLVAEGVRLRGFSSVYRKPKAHRPNVVPTASTPEWFASELRDIQRHVG